MKKFGVCLFFLMISQYFLFAQSEHITITKDNRVDTLIERHIEFNSIQNSIPGYRIQIFSGSGNFSRSNATTVQQKFAVRYQDIKTYLIFSTPYYMVRVGNFRTRLDAEAYRQKIIDTYPEAYIIRDDIELP